jgi:hypothetical protein
MLQSHLTVCTQGLSPVVCCLHAFPTSGSCLSPTCCRPSCHLFTGDSRSLAPCSSSLLWCTFSNPCTLCCVLVFSSVVYCSVFFCVWRGSVCPGRSCWLIPGVAEGCRVMLGVHPFGLLKVFWAHLELVTGGSPPPPSLNISWHGEAFHGLGFQGPKVSTLSGASPLLSVAPVSHQSPWFTELTLSASVPQSPSWILCEYLKAARKTACLGSPAHKLKKCRKNMETLHFQPVFALSRSLCSHHASPLESVRLA